MKKVITYGTYDLLHYGHIALLERAKALGDYLIVGVTSDAFDKNRGKLNVKQSLYERIKAIEDTGLADKIIVEEYVGQKVADIQKYHVDTFAIGSDWEGKFDYLKEFCQVVYLPRTKGISSTQLRAKENRNIKMGIIGCENPAERFVGEIPFVSGIEAVGVYESSKEKRKRFAEQFQLTEYQDVDKMLQNVDAVHIFEPAEKKYELIKKCLLAGCHVICKSPIFLKRKQADELYQLALAKQLVLMEGIKTLYFPAFEHMELLINSGEIGKIKDIDLSCSQIPEEMKMLEKDCYRGAIYDWGATAIAPIIKLLGTNYEKAEILDYTENGFNYFTRGIIKYRDTSASFKVGVGIKTEGDMIITGTKGYIYVPAPWWKIEYFETRYEDLRKTKKYFYPFAGEGFRYEILEFVRAIQGGLNEMPRHNSKAVVEETNILELYQQKQECKTKE